MSGFVHFVKTIFIPLFLAALLYVVLAHLLLPFIRRHRTRYSQYLPMTADMSLATASWRTRISDALYNLFIPSSWARSNRLRVVDGSGGEHADDELFDDEEGEGMVGFDPIDERRREALEQRRSMMGDEQRRLGRELEEGFKDDSDNEHEDERRRSLSRTRTSASFY
ncbi:hypothetical protein K491DRAFT_696282 [Lophiostoma macrostomum CBS 122681]|uniref:Uncharacterized protein n=1 Tax=Lophiostoma macrostomum CBS 122681 TaxID=1314788 RepID=A0A6A6SVG8_9PLEO|nr:hypothetical protein K491DRAFT_696282 [Lophiostoma macrostomum CBS 122681]